MEILSKFYPKNQLLITTKELMQQLKTSSLDNDTIQVKMADLVNYMKIAERKCFGKIFTASEFDEARSMRKGELEFVGSHLVLPQISLLLN